MGDVLTHSLKPCAGWVDSQLVARDLWVPAVTDSMHELAFVLGMHFPAMFPLGWSPASSPGMVSLHVLRPREAAATPLPRTPT